MILFDDCKFTKISRVGILICVLELMDNDPWDPKVTASVIRAIRKRGDRSDYGNNFFYWDRGYVERWLESQLEGL